MQTISGYPRRARTVYLDARFRGAGGEPRAEKGERRISMHVHGTLKFESARCVCSWRDVSRRFVNTNTIRCSIKKGGGRGREWKEEGKRSPRLDRDWRPRNVEGRDGREGDLLSIRGRIKNEYSWPRLSKHNADRLNVCGPICFRRLVSGPTFSIDTFWWVDWFKRFVIRRWEKWEWFYYWKIFFLFFG